MKPAYKYISQTKLGATTNSLYRHIMTELADVRMTRRHEVHVTTRLTLVNIELKLKQKGCRAILYDNYIRVLSGTLPDIDDMTDIIDDAIDDAVTEYDRH